MWIHSIPKGRLLVVAVCGACAASSLRTFLSQAEVEEVPISRPYASTTMYCRNWLPGDGRVWEVIGGSGETRMLPEGVSGEPSRRLHAGHRWFADIHRSGGEPGVGPATPRDLYVTRDDGFTIKLPLPPGVEPLADSVQWPLHTEDHTLAWVGRRCDRSGAVLEGGIYTTQLEYDPEGRIVGGKAPTESPLLSLPLVAGADSDQWGHSLVPDVESQDWSPDGSSVVLVSRKGELSVVEVDSGTVVQLTDHRASGAVWSPDGDLIAFKMREPLGGIAIVPAKGGVVEVVFGPEQGTPFAVTPPHWLPSGSCMIVGYVSSEWIAPEQPVKPDLIVLDLINGRYRSLPTKPAGSVVPVAWR